MLSKYNLNVGNSIFKEKINKEAESTETDQNYCARIATEQGGYLRYDEFYDIDGYEYVKTTMGQRFNSASEIKPIIRKQTQGNLESGDHRAASNVIGRLLTAAEVGVVVPGISSPEPHAAKSRLHIMMYK